MATHIDYTRRLQSLLEIGQNFSRNLDLPEFLQVTINNAAELINCEDCSLMAYDTVDRNLHFIAGSWDQFSLLKPLQVPLEGSVAGWVFSHAHVLVLQDASQDERIFRQVDRILHTTTRSIMAVPLVYHEQVVGVLEAVNKKDGLPFSQDDIEIAKVLASQMAVALQMETLVQRTEQTNLESADLERRRDEFVELVVREMRTPVGQILNHAALLRPDLKEDQIPQMDIIVRHAIHLKDVIEQFSHSDALARGATSLEPEQVTMNHLLEEIVESYQDMAHQHAISLVADVSRAHIIMNVDAEKLNGILDQLIKNALSYTNPGGHVLVKAVLMPGQVRVSVIDDGIGIPANQVKKVFDRFYQVEAHLNRRQGGTGLGLAIARDMVTLMGGKIWAESVEGRGSRFTFTLPINPARAEA
ncbi:MAG TPA: HAMP domain-containing sensor histidine kinase [Anaerolineaceae bacterium]|nr:HAMP domain-containing sensor histidine kinase [Anaerolineaceae bacterium]HPN51387.1 HAMP domain-containing sensor histidine kinase [Anaerolineaceae bacterium]